MPRKTDIRQVDAFVRTKGLTPEQEYDFREYIHQQKDAGRMGTGNPRGDYTWNELEELYRELFGK